MSELVKVIEQAGFGVVIGADAVVEKMINLAPPEGGMKLCSGYGVFPDGEKCCGCTDCQQEESNEKEKNK